MRWAARVKSEQAAWLAARGVKTGERGYAVDVAANLLLLSQEARAELGAGSGAELGTVARAGKLAAPWSSSALTVNVFEYWRTEEKEVLEFALGLSATPRRLRFEVKLQTGFSLNAPANLDVVLDRGPDAACVAIESKFLEPFDGGPGGKLRDDFVDTYFDSTLRASWNGLDNLRELAASLRPASRARKFWRLDVPQLTKHAIALRRNGQPFELILLWYSPPGDLPETRVMLDEIDQFTVTAARDDVRFRALTYQDVFTRMRASGMSGDYLSYLESRYFGTRAPCSKATEAAREA